MTSISVIVTTHNRRDLLRSTLDSLQAQTLPASEVIVVDDGSTDGTADMLRQEYPWVMLVEQSNTGLASARNHGIALSASEWIAFCDDDDVWLPQKIKSLSPRLSDASVGAIYHPVQPFDGTQAVGSPIHGIDMAMDSYAACMLGPPSVPSGMVVRRLVALRAGLFPPDAGYGEDWAFALNVARLVPWTLHPDPLTLLRLHDGRSSSSGAAPVRDSYVLAGVPLRVWFTGRPLPERVSIKQQREQLRDMGPHYREIYRGHFREVLGRRSWREARTFWRVLRLILPRFRDRAVVLLPGVGRLAGLRRRPT